MLADLHMAIIDIDMVSTVDLSGSRVTYDVQPHPHEPFLKDVGHCDMLQKVGSLHDTYMTATLCTKLRPVNLGRIVGMVCWYYGVCAIPRRNREKGEVATSPAGTYRAYVDRSENNTAALCFEKRKEVQGDPLIKLFKGF